MSFKFNCPKCNQSLEAPESMLDSTIECPVCNSSIQLSDSQTPPIPPKYQPQCDEGFYPEPATEKQISYIRDLGGNPPLGLTKEKASELIDNLRNSVPPTAKQIGFLKSLGGTVAEGMTVVQVSDLISQLDDNQPPTKNQVEFIKMLGGKIPETKLEASELCESLPTMSPATIQQEKDAVKLGIILPENITFEQANKIIDDAELDADPEEGKPPTKSQINKIVKLGGKLQEDINYWRAEEYIEALEEKRDDFIARIENAIDWCFVDTCLPVKKPSKAVMAKALQYGDVQGWGKDWEDDSEDFLKFMAVAVYAVAPELLKKNESPPQLHDQSNNSNGCLLPFTLLIGTLGACIILITVFLVL